MEALTTESPRLFYTEYDRIAIPDDIPELGVKKGNEGVIRRLNHDRDNVTAAVMVTYSTNQPRGWVDVQIKPEKKVSSYTTL